MDSSQDGRTGRDEWTVKGQVCGCQKGQSSAFGISDARPVSKFICSTYGAPSVSSEVSRHEELEASEAGWPSPRVCDAQETLWTPRDLGRCLLGFLALQIPHEERFAAS